MNPQSSARNSYQMTQMLKKLGERPAVANPQGGVATENYLDQVMNVYSECLGPSEMESPKLKDEFSAKLVEEVVMECRRLVKGLRDNPDCWHDMRVYLEDHLWGFVRLKEDFAEAEKQVRMVQKRLEEVSQPLQGEVNQKRLLACSMVMAEKKMRRDHLQDRVSMIIDEFVGRILVGTQNEPGGEALELRVRGVFGSL